MPDENVDNRTISKNNQGFPEYLDFEKLRRESIVYLGNLSGKIWTDHNVHDPGITILETLCYALLDLGYRTNLPIADILTPNPESKVKERSFFTPAEILTCNPLTITDFRKLLIDIEGVNNAWLEIAEEVDLEEYCGKDENDVCSSKRSKAIEATNKKAIHYLNGLYHVYVDIQQIHEDPQHQIQKDHEAIIIDKIRRALMSHRNICEDFIDIKILCRDKLGLCAEIEIEPGAEIEKIYLALIEQVREYFSPLPKFYTLENLLVDRKKTIDLIFGGRPHNLKESHGFVDTEEFEKLELKKKLHLSDLYNLLQKVPGIIRITKLRFNKCNPQVKLPKTWEYQLPKNHIPELDLNCTNISFIASGMPVTFDDKQYADLIGLNFSNDGKILHKMPSPYLDTIVPKGIYRSDMNQYIPLQNDFPKVYGISDGGLPASASLKRQAQAFQLKGYLLFFDQLLANYLGQLQNLRSLFSFSHGKDGQKSTYYANELSGPGLQDLLRFNIESGGTSFMGSQNSPIAFPVKKSIILQQAASGKIDPDKMDQYSFKTESASRVAMHQVQNDIQHSDYSFEFISRKDECVYFYLITSSDEFGLVGKKHFSSETEAKRVTEGLRYAALFDENYRSFINPAGDFSFNLEMNLFSYPRYLKKIVESEDLYMERRKEFLDHLLLRFAEQFTDYAIIAFKSQEGSTQRMQEISDKEKFLSHYDYLSSNRGRAYDYLKDGWNNKNISGFEQRFKALCGIGDWSKKALCNFEVAEHKKEYVASLKFKDELFFSSEEQFISPEEAGKGAWELFNELQKTESYSVKQLAYRQGWGISLQYGEQCKQASLFKKGKGYKSEIEAKEVYERLAEHFQQKTYEKRIFDSTYKYRPLIKTYNEEKLAFEYTSFIPNDPEEAKKAGLKNIKKLNNKEIWNEGKGDLPKKLFPGYERDNRVYLIDDRAFREHIDINSNDEDQPDKHRFELLAVQNAFRLVSTNLYTSRKQALEAANQLKVLLLDEFNYLIEPDKDDDREFYVLIKKGDEVVARSGPERKPELANKRMEKIRAHIMKYTYFIEIEKQTATWAFNFKSGFEPDSLYTFRSGNDYPLQEDAIADARLLHLNTGQVLIKREEDRLVLNYDHEGRKISCRQISQSPPTNEREVRQGEYQEEPDLAIRSLRKNLDIQQEINDLYGSNQPEEFIRFTSLDPLSETGIYFYRLVDKNGQYAAFKKSGDQPENVGTAIIDEAFDSYSSGYNFLEVVLNGEITFNRTDNKKKWYHFQLKSANAIRKPGLPQLQKHLVLLESVKGYRSKEEAEEAFRKLIHTLLSEGTQFRNYGAGKLISIQELIVHGDEDDFPGKSLVFIPKETLQFLGEYDEKGVRELIKVFKSYPVRSFKIPGDCEGCRILFPPDEPEEEECDKPCLENEEKTVYYFALFNKIADEDDWQSVKYYSTREKALKAFYFFLFLLEYKGNYLVNCDCEGKYRVFVREVLAESATRFMNRDDAWGKDGIQKFICVAQSKDAFHLFQHKLPSNCCYTFDVACKNLPVFHPCKYDNPAQRDKVLARLLEDWEKYYTETTTLDTDLVKNERGEVLAKIIKKADQPDSKYAFEVAPAQYNSVQGQSEDECDCYVDWVSDYCYADYADAFIAFNQAAKILSENINYQAVFDCCCGSYGIDLYKRLNPANKTIIIHPDDPFATIAYNPQCYRNSDEVCTAVERAKYLINSEGLHMVEHILLRPRHTEDCACRIPTCCDELDDCAFIWEEESEDICETRSPVWFIPGYDPYSFIATVVLPAWPERFRKLESRIMVEDLLRREAPAHVMLRILWLTPYDLCIFEDHYKRWNHWLGETKYCSTDFSMEMFIKFLFKSGFECLEDCKDCLPCEETSKPPGCFEDEKLPSSSTIATDFRQQLDSLFCWPPSVCPRPAFQPMEKRKAIQQRYQAYRDTAQEIKERTGDERAGRVGSFLLDNSPSANKLTEVLKKIEGSGKAKISTDKKINADDQQKLQEISIMYYMDTICIEEEYYRYRNQELLETLEKIKGDPKTMEILFRKWKHDEMIRINPDLRLHEIQKGFGLNVCLCNTS